MSTRAAVVGTAVVAAGVLLALAPGLADALGLDLPTLAIVLVGLACLALAYVAYRTRRETRRDYAAPDAVEHRREYDRPGGDFRADFRNVRDNPRGRRWRERVHDRLYGAAVEVLRAEGHTEAEATRLLASGEWTDDPHAAAFFAGDVREASLTDRVRAVLSSEPPFARRARRVVAELDERTEGP